MLRRRDYTDASGARALHLFDEVNPTFEPISGFLSGRLELLCNGRLRKTITEYMLTFAPQISATRGIRPVSK